MTAIKNYANGDNVECLRTHILSEFRQIKHDAVGHDCCLLCHEKCHCNGNNPCDKQIPINLHKNHPESNPKTLWKKRKVMADEIKLLEELLHDYQQKLISSCPTYFLSPEYTTGFSDNLKKSILSKAKYIFDIEYVLHNLYVFNVQHATDITYMCAEVFGDFEVHIDEKYTKMAKTNQAVSGEGNYDLDFGGSYAEYHGESESSESESEFP